MPNVDPYSRIYHRLADEFPDLFDDDAALALWMRLLMFADMAWPTAAYLPLHAKPKALEHLVESGLVVVTGSRYRIRGMDKERSRRQASASNAARTRWGDAGRNADRNAGRITNGHADRNAEAMPRREEKSNRRDNVLTKPKSVREILPTLHVGERE